MWRRALSLILVSLQIGILTSQSIHASNKTSLSVMTRNIYLGADVGVALDLLPDFPAAAQFMWDQMRQTNFETRAERLADEFAVMKPDVIGIQEATTWICRKGFLSKRVVVYDFLDILIAATKRTDVSYSLIQKDGDATFNTGFSIPAIPRLTMVTDSETFPSLFGQNEAACGFEIADALLIRDGLDAKVLQLGNREFENHYTVVPLVMEIHRGYTWVDLEVEGKPFRVVTTHLESLFDEEGVPPSVIQAEQLINDLSSSQAPLVVMGDFNADPRDPRGKSSPNPGGQPEANETCPPQEEITEKLEIGNAACNAYWKMIEAGYEDVGPNALNPKNFTWGASALLNGPDQDRGVEARRLGNRSGFTDRLDYIFVKNGITIISSELISHTWPRGRANWNCRIGLVDQRCFPSDHAGLFTTIEITTSSTLDEPLPENLSIPWLLYFTLVALALFLVFIAWALYRVVIMPLLRRVSSRSLSERVNQGHE